MRESRLYNDNQDCAEETAPLGVVVTARRLCEFVQIVVVVVVVFGVMHVLLVIGVVLIVHVTRMGYS